MIQKVRRHPCGLRLLVSIRFQVYFTPLVGVLFTFPSRYWFAIGRYKYLGLEGGPPIFRQSFTCSALLEASTSHTVYGAITHYGPTFQTVPLVSIEALAWSAFARHY
jgi:hypothetical protein